MESVASLKHAVECELLSTFRFAQPLLQCLYISVCRSHYSFLSVSYNNAVKPAAVYAMKRELGSPVTYSSDFRCREGNQVRIAIHEAYPVASCHDLYRIACTQNTFAFNADSTVQ